MIKVLFASALVLTLFGCDGGGGGGNDAPNSRTYPDVTGTYAFKTSDAYGKCSDGSAGTTTGNSFPIEVFQNESVLKFVNSNAEKDAEALGITVLESSGMSGVLNLDGTFTVNQELLAKSQGETVYVYYLLEGQFTQTNMYGDYKYEIHIQDYPASCYFTATFEGTKVSTKDAVKSAPLFENVDVDVYDTHGVILRLLGTVK